MVRPLADYCNQTAVFLWSFELQIHFEIGELPVIGILAILTLFGLIPVVGKGIVNRLKKKNEK
jgi:hypothetical protein